MAEIQYWPRQENHIQDNLTIESQSLVQQGHNFKENLSSIADMYDNSKMISSLKDIFCKAKMMGFAYKEINSIFQGIYRKSSSSKTSLNI